MPAVPFRPSASLLLCAIVAAVLAACGGSGGADPVPAPVLPTPLPNPQPNPLPTPPDSAPAPTITLLAGTASGYGNADGPAAAARFAGPRDMVYDAAGNAYVLDSAGIRKLSTTGVVTTLVRAEGANAFLTGATGIAIDKAGTIYVAATSTNTIRRVSPQGEVTLFAGIIDNAGSADGPLASAQFFLPVDVAVDQAGNLYVADSGNARVRKVTPDGQVSTLAGGTRALCSAQPSGTVCDLRDGPGAQARFSNPSAIAVDAAGSLAVVDQFAIRRISPAGVVSTLPGRIDAAELTFGSDGALFVAGPSVLRITASGSVSTLADASTLGTGANQFGMAASGASAIAIDTGGNVVITDVATQMLRRIGTDGVLSHIAGQPDRLAYDDHAGGVMRFGILTALTVDGAGNVYLVDEGRLRKITPQGKLSTLAQWESGAIDSFIGNEPSAATVDAGGNVYVADASQILKISPTGTITILAGVKEFSLQADGPVATARFGKLQAITADAQGRLYVVDQNAVRVVNADGSVRTLAGHGDDNHNMAVMGAVDGQGSAARFAQPRGIAVDAGGTVYVADRGNGTIRKITPTGLVSTLAGSAGQLGSADGTGTAARFDQLSGLTIDSAGTLYATDAGSRTVRRITSAGVVSTLAGRPGAIGLTLGPLPGSLGVARGLAWHGGALYVIDGRAVVKLPAPAQ